MSKSIKHLTLAAAMLVALPSYALQIKTAVDNEPVHANISVHELTRIFVEGDKISNVVGISGSYLLQNDESQGAIFIKPSAGYIAAARRAKEAEERKIEEENIAAKILESQNKVEGKIEEKVIELKPTEAEIKQPTQEKAVTADNKLPAKEIVKPETITKKIATEESQKPEVKKEEKQSEQKKALKTSIKKAITKKAKSPSLKPLNLFVSTQSGHNYVLLLNPINTHSETIMLKPQGLKKPLVSSDTQPPPRIVKLITAMVNGAVSDEYTINHLGSGKKPQYKLGAAELFLTSVYSNEELRGEVYRLVNKSDQDLIITEQQFYREGVRAVTLQDRVIPPLEETFVYVVTQ